MCWALDKGFEDNNSWEVAPTFADIKVAVMQVRIALTLPAPE